MAPNFEVILIECKRKCSIYHVIFVRIHNKISLFRIIEFTRCNEIFIVHLLYESLFVMVHMKLKKKHCKNAVLLFYCLDFKTVIR